MLLKRVENLDDFTSPPSSETEPRLIWLLLRRFMASLMDPMSCTIASSRVPNYYRAVSEPRPSANKQEIAHTDITSTSYSK